MGPPARIRPGGKAESGTWGSQISHRRTQTHTDINFIKGFTVCVCLRGSVANYIKKAGWEMFRFGIWDFGLRPVGSIGAYAPEGLRI